jgi:hypothetical protein
VKDSASPLSRRRLGLLAGSLTALAASAAGCHPAAAGALTATGYENEAYGFKVNVSGGTVGDDWDLDNYTKNGDGNFVPKGGDPYETTLLIDANDDGSVDAQEKGPTYDLRLHNPKHDAVIWLRAVPLAPGYKDKTMGEIAKKYVDQVPSFGYEAVQLAAPASTTGGKHLESKVADRAEITLAGKEAYVTRLNVRPSSDAKWTGVEVVLVRPGFERTVQVSGNPVKVPVVLVAGYANSPDNFTADEAAFRKFLGEIEIAGRRGMTAPKPVAASPGDSPASADGGAGAAPAAGH